MTKWEEFFAGAAFALVLLGAIATTSIGSHVGDLNYLFKSMSLMASGHFLFAIVKLKMIRRYDREKNNGNRNQRVV